MKSGKVFYGEQRLTALEALRSYTLDAAYAIFEEKMRGSITKGKLADLVVLSRDITKIDPGKIRDTKVLLTFVGGELVFDSNQTKSTKPASK